MKCLARLAPAFWLAACAVTGARYVEADLIADKLWWGLLCFAQACWAVSALRKPQ